MKKKRVETFRKIYGMVTVTVKKKRVETFRNIYGMVTVVYIIIIIIITSAMLSIVGERERTHLGSIYAHARFLSGCSGMVECLAS